MKNILPSEVLSQHIAVLGKTGSGKTSTVKLIIEQLLREDPSARVCILDPLKSDHWGLTRAADGKGKGLPFYVLGGPMGHVPLSASAGAALGQVVASGALQLSILDMADFDMGEHAKFFITFAQALFRNMQGVVHLVVEEAHVFAPKERSGYGEENKSTYWMKKMATGARSKGVRMIPSTQRTQELHNAVLGSCDTIIVHRITLPADQEPVAKWLAGNIGKEKATEITASFSSLKTGEGWICSGEAQIMERRTFPRITTYDNSRTPEAGDRGKEIRPAPVDEESLRTIIGSAVAEAKANDPAELKRRIAELEKQAKAVPVVKVAAPEMKRVEVKVLTDAQVTRLEKVAENKISLAAKLAELIDVFRERMDTEEAKANEIVAVLKAFRESLAVPKPLPARPMHAPIAMPVNRQPMIRKATAADDGHISAGSCEPSILSKPGQRILNAMAWWKRIGVEEPTRNQTGLVARVNPGGGYFDNIVGPLVSSGYVHRTGGRIRLLPAGEALAHTHDSIDSLAEYSRMILAQFKGPTARMLQALIAGDKREWTREELGEASGVNPGGGYFDNSIGPLSAIGLIERRSGRIVPTALIFPDGLY